VLDEGNRLPLEGREERTTNNRMELRAAIEGLASTAPGCQVTIYSDSQYLVHTMTRNWKRKANLDLWQKLDALSRERRVKWEWRPGEEGPGLAEVHRRADGMAGIKAPQPVRMVDVGDKPVTRRQAVARALVRVAPQTVALIQKGGLPKGDPMAAAQVAGILAAKDVPRLIPLCHPLPIDDVRVDLRLDSNIGAVEITASVLGEARTGYEMEALTAAAVAALTIYDMLKAQDPGPTIELKLLSKSGGKSGTVVLP
jgi:cyclic pyranopterin phosphate synthase